MDEPNHWSLRYADEILMGIGSFMVFGLARMSLDLLSALALSVFGAFAIVVIRYFAPVEPMYGPHQ